MDTLWAAGGSGIITQGDCSSLGIPFGHMCVCVCGGGGGRNGVSADGNAGDGVVGNV